MQLNFNSTAKRPIRTYAPSMRAGSQAYFHAGLTKSVPSFGGGEPPEYSSHAGAKVEKTSIRDRVAKLQAKATAVRAQKTPIKK